MTSDLGAPRDPERPASASASPRPKDIDTAFWLWIAAMVAFLISIPVALPSESVMSQKLAQNAAMRGRQLSPADTTAMVATMRTGIIVFLLVLALIWLLFILKMRAGRSWARILLAVFGGLAAVSTLLQLLQGQPAGVLALTVVLGILIVAAIVMMFRPAAASYFRDR